MSPDEVFLPAVTPKSMPRPRESIKKYFSKVTVS
jgi:hypothetical protein